MAGSFENPAFVNYDKSNNQSYTNNGDKHAVESKDLKKVEEATGLYDPYLHRNVEHPTTNAETLLHLLKGSLGTGILAMPLAFYHSGYILGIICTTLIGAICTYCIHMLVNAEYELCQRHKLPSLNYPQTAQMALKEGPPLLQKLAPYAPHVVNGFLVLYQLGVCCVYTVFLAENIKDVADRHMDPLDLQIWMLIFLLPLILINFIRNLKFLAPFSTFANIITITSFAIILYYLIKTNMTFENRDAVGEIGDFPLYFGTVLFALEAVGVIMPLENEMKTPKSFISPCGVLNTAMIFIVTLYVGMGLLGYLAYGANTADTITLNIPPDEIPAQVAKIMLAVAIYISHPLQMYVAIDIQWNHYLATKFEKNRHRVLFEYMFRTFLVLITFALAAAIPKLGLFISLFGALCLSAVGLSFPAIIQTSTYWYSLNGTKGKLIILKNCLILIFGVIGMVVGSYVSIQQIIESFYD